MREPIHAQSYFRETFEGGLLKIGESFPVIPNPHETKTSLIETKDKIINFILPLAGRLDAFQRFVSVYEDVCVQDDRKTTLTLVLYPSLTEPTSFGSSVDIVQRLQSKYPLAKFNIVPASGTFARAEALELGARKYDDNVDDLLFFIDVDMVFTSKTLDRIRTNTIKGKQAYFPIVFSEYDPDFSNEGSSTLKNHFMVDRDSGYWRQFGYGIMSVYKSDLKTVGGFDTGIHGWGKEDVDLFNKFVSTATNFSVFRAVDPQLVHVFHIVDCDTKLDDVQLAMCMGSRADTYGSVPQLAKYIYNHKDQILEFAKYRKHQKSPS